MTETQAEKISLGRRSISKSLFVAAVLENDSVTNVCKYLGLNPTPQSTRNQIESAIKKLGLDICHFRYRYTKGEAFVTAVEQKTKKYEDISSNSKSNYKCLIGNFLELIGEQDLCKIDYHQLEEYAQNKKLRGNAEKCNCNN